MFHAFQSVDFGIIISEDETVGQKEIEVVGGAKVLAQMPVVVSAGCSIEMRL